MFSEIETPWYFIYSNNQYKDDVDDDLNGTCWSEIKSKPKADGLDSCLEEKM